MAHSCRKTASSELQSEGAIHPHRHGTAGFGKRTSAYEYRLSGRGGQGITGMGLTSEEWRRQVAGSFPVTDAITRSCWSPMADN